MSYRLSIRGLTISARRPAISARRRRRISSSLLPLNIGPHTTSSQPPARGCVLITREKLTARADDASGAPDVRVRVPRLEPEPPVEPVRRLPLGPRRQLDRDRARLP